MADEEAIEYWANVGALAAYLVFAFAVTGYVATWLMRERVEFFLGLAVVAGIAFLFSLGAIKLLRKAFRKE